MRIAKVLLLCLGAGLLGGRLKAAPLTNEATLRIPRPGDNELRILSPILLEVRLITAKASRESGPPNASEFQVFVDGRSNLVAEAGFRRRALYAPLAVHDLRIDNCYYLQLTAPIADGQSVEVRNPDASLWAGTMKFTARANPLRFNPAIHVNQTGYLPAMSKTAMVGYYLGTLGEMPVAATNFFLVDVKTGAEVFKGNLVPSPDVGFNCNPLPYQNVLAADFSAFTNAGQYVVAVPGLGVSFPFFIDDGVAAAFARAYALGLYEQRCGTSNALPFTRFTHPACHTAPASVPMPESAFANAWRIIAGYGSSTNANNPPQSAPLLTNAADQLYPFIRKGRVDVSGGHHDAGDYSKYTINSASLIHLLVFAADSLPGVGALDNLGLPESGDGKSDILEEAKWEADFLAKMQDADGGFYFLVYPRDREYENNVTPDHGDPQIVWPKNTAGTAAAVAALAQCSSSRLFRAEFPDAARHYLAKAELGWKFLTNAIALHGRAGAYQKLLAYGDDFTDNDELAWAACEMYLATGDPQYQQKLFEWLPDPSDKSTYRWGWWRMNQSYGNAIRSYAFAAHSKRLPLNRLDAAYLARCEGEIIAAADDELKWARQCAYGSSFPTETKRFLSGGWYFSMSEAFDLAVACGLDDYPPMNDPRPEYLTAILGNMNYEGGCNPVNVSFVAGLGWKRQRETVNQYAQNDGRALPPTGIPVGNITASFDYLPTYQGELRAISFPPDEAATGAYPIYDRWGDSFNVQTEPTCLDMARQLATAALLMARTPLATQRWKSTPAQIILSEIPEKGAAVLATVRIPNFELSKARVVWEAQNGEPAFGDNYWFMPTNNCWVEVEAQLPDGRRAFGVTNFNLRLLSHY